MKRLIVILSIAILAFSCVGTTSNGGSAQGTQGSHGAKYIFYFIGDGMAAPQVALGQAALNVPQFRDNYAAIVEETALRDSLYINGMSVVGLATTSAANRYITDSAAAGTALATGEKTDVGIISQTPEGKGITTIAEIAKSRGMKVGVVSSVSIDHATPACFYAHAKSRGEYLNISNQLLHSGFDYFAGGSVKWDKRAAMCGGDMAQAYNSYRFESEARGYKFVTSKSELERAKSGDRVIATLDKLSTKQYVGDGSAMPYTIDLESESSEDDKITLAEYTRKGIDILQGDGGFFMMVEGGKIDWACHANDAATAAYEVLAFDEAVGVALEFAKKHPAETLIVVTGDHDCGGLALGFAGTRYESALEVLAASRTSFDRFSKQAKRRIGAGESFESMLKFARAEFGLTEKLSKYELSRLKSAYAKSAKRERLSEEDKHHASFGGYDPFTTTCTNILNNRAGVDFSSYSHTALPVMVFAEGAGAELFTGYYDNTDIAKRIMTAAGL